MSKNTIVRLVGVIFVAAVLTMIFVDWPQRQATSPVEVVSALPQVREFVSDVAKANSGRTVTYRPEITADGDTMITVAESSPEKERVWKRFLVKKNGHILVENSLTGEFE